MSKKKFLYAGREFGLTLVTEGTKLQRVIIDDGGLEFPFAQGGYDKVADFLVDEYGGKREDALKLLNETEPLTGLDITGAPAAVTPEKSKKGSAKKGSKKADAKTEKKAEEEAAEKPEEVPKPAKPESIIKTFNIKGEATEKKLQTKTVLPGQKPESVEDVKLDDLYAIHIDIYSKKNRTTALYAIKDGVDVSSFPESIGELILGGVSLMDVIYAYAEKVDMSFPQADKYIKIKRGLLPEPEPKKVKETKKKDDEKKDVNTEAPATEAPATEAPATEAPATEAPATEVKESKE